MKVPATRYVELGDRQVAWQAFGNGPDMILLTGLSGHLDLQWELPEAAQFLTRLGGFCRVIQFMPPGLGLSDPAPAGAIPYDWNAEFLAVMKAASAERVFIYADREAGPAAIRFADRQPERVAGLVLANTSARVNRDRDYPEGAEPTMFAALEQFLLGAWGTPEMARLSMPSHDNDPNFLEVSARLMRATCTPLTATRWFNELAALDVRAEARRLNCPVLLLKRRDFPFGSPEAMGWLAANMADARLVEIAGADIMFSHDRASEALGHIQEFMTGGRAVNVADRRFQVLLFLDIVKSTQTAVQIGDLAWHELLERFHALVGSQIARFGGAHGRQRGRRQFLRLQPTRTGPGLRGGGARAGGVAEPDAQGRLACGGMRDRRRGRSAGAGRAYRRARAGHGRARHGAGLRDLPADRHRRHADFHRTRAAPAERGAGCVETLRAGRLGRQRRAARCAPAPARTASVMETQCPHFSLNSVYARRLAPAAQPSGAE